MGGRTPSNEQVCEWFDTLSNWGRWGDEDLLGTLNLITEEKRREAVGLVTEGVTVSCGLPIRFDEHNLDDRWPEPQRFMRMMPPREPDHVGRGASADAVLLNCHGLTLTHLDCPAHHFFKPAPDRAMQGFNGLSPDVVTPRDGLLAGDITLVADGIASRGVLLDIAALRGVDWLEPRTKIFPEDLEEAEERQGVKVGPGDILCIRSGHPARKRALGWNTDPETQAGPDGACLPWFKERDIALLACDTANDVFPPDPGLLERPVHSIGIPAMGMWLLDGADYENLAEQCAKLNRWDFLYTISPLQLRGSTASPVNPIAFL